MWTPSVSLGVGSFPRDLVEALALCSGLEPHTLRVAVLIPCMDSSLHSSPEDSGNACTVRYTNRRMFSGLK